MNSTRSPGDGREESVYNINHNRLYVSEVFSFYTLFFSHFHQLIDSQLNGILIAITQFR
jgi:hypothetical protein